MRTKEKGVLISVDKHDMLEIVTLAKKLDDIGMKIYATSDTAKAIMALGIDVTLVRGIREGDDGFDLLDEGKVEYIVYTGALYDATVRII